MLVAARGGCIELIRALHLRGMSLDDRNCDSQTPLMIAAFVRKYETSLVLMELGADITTIHDVSSYYYFKDS